MKTAAQNGGMAFGQEMIIYNDTIRETVRMEDKEYIYRVLCEKDGRLCVIESERKVKFDDFKKRLMDYGVSNAIYTDMGNGWNYAWYRSDGKIIILQPYKHPYCTNWITFYR